MVTLLMSSRADPCFSHSGATLHKPHQGAYTLTNTSLPESSTCIWINHISEIDGRDAKPPTRLCTNQSKCPILISPSWYLLSLSKLLPLMALTGPVVSSGSTSSDLCVACHRTIREQGSIIFSCHVLVLGGERGEHTQHVHKLSSSTKERGYAPLRRRLGAE